MDGFVEMITVMLALGGFDLAKDPDPPTANTVLRYAVPAADAMAYVDTVAVLPGNYEALLAVPDADALGTDRDLRVRARELATTLEGAVALARTALHVDVIHDVTSVTMFVEHVADADAHRLIVVRGDLPAALVGDLATLLGGATGAVDGRATLEVDGVLIGRGEDGALLIGTPAWVAPRLDDDWRAPKRKKRGAWKRIADQLGDAPVAVLAAMPDADAAAAAAAAVDLPLVGDLIEGASLAIVAIRTDGIAITWKTRTRAALRQAALALDGGVELMRAAAIAPRGLARLGLAALAGRAGDDGPIDAVLARQTELLALIDDASGDGTFDVVRKQHDDTRTLTLRATGDELADVIPAALVIPAFAAALLDDDRAQP